MEGEIHESEGVSSAMLCRVERSFAYHLARDSWLPSVVAQARAELPRTVEAPRLARRALQDRAGARLRPDEEEIVEVLTTELVTNAVQHAGLDPGETVALRFAVAPERVRVEVCDGGAGLNLEELARPRARPGGYGLVLVNRGASRWGASRDDGNCVWFELDREAAAG